MTHVAVVGAGIIGAALADRLAHRGVSVTVVDSGQPGAGTSGTSLAWLNANQKLPRHYHDMSVRAMADWCELAEGFGMPRWYVPSGSLTWAQTDDQRAALTGRVERLRSWGYPAVELTAEQAAALEPSLRVPAAAEFAYFAAEGFVHGDRAVQALLAHAQAGGAELIITGADVTLEAAGARITAVRLPDGSRVRADIYVCCAGWRTSALLEPLGVSVPLIPGDAPGSPAPCLVSTVSGPVSLSRVVHGPGLNLRPAAESGLQLESGEINDLVDVHTAPADLDRLGAQLLNRAAEVVTGFAAVRPRHRLCIRPLPVDGHPVVGRLPSLDNAYLAVTHSGMTLAPLLGRLIADEIVGGAEVADLEPYRPARFGSS
jgi:glycine/D-amino acid oxidase-like deaminating enzyme